VTACSHCGGVTVRVRVEHHEHGSTLARECASCGKRVPPIAVPDEATATEARP
jgi:RNase P subunit RPR2